MDKSCTKCKESKLETEEHFYFRKDTGKFRDQCISCMNGDSLKYREENIENIRVIEKERSTKRNILSKVKEYKAQWHIDNVKNNLEVQEHLILYRKNYNIKVGRSTGESQSKEEKQIENWLKANGFKFEMEKRFDDCRNQNGELLFFDFYFENFKINIEYDGPHHRKPLWGQEKFHSTQRHDKIKDKYCLKNGIEMIRITDQQN